MVKKLSIGGLDAQLPIIQGGMGVGISLAGLAAAVANEGGIGVIAAAGIGMPEPDFFSNYLSANIRALKKEIVKARNLTKGILGVNIMVALTDYSEMVGAAVEKGIDIIFSGGGLPLDLPQLIKGRHRPKLVPIVSSARAARLICKRWSERYHCLPDAFVVEGPMAGGHLGFKEEQINDPAFHLEKLVPQVIDAVSDFSVDQSTPIPIVAAGGIYTGKDISHYLALGAAGVQMGTRFVTTEECNASQEFKQTYIDASAEDIIIIKSPVGMPGRAVRNGFLDDVNQGKKKPYRCPYHCIRTCDYERSPYCIFFALVNAQRGKMKNGFAFAGANAYRAEGITTVPELMKTLMKEFIEEEETKRLSSTSTKT